MIAKNGTSTLVARVNVPFLAIMVGCRGLLGWGQGKIAGLASKTALSAADGAETAIFATPARAADTTGVVRGAIDFVTAEPEINTVHLAQRATTR
jgi:hypothetical protein